MKKMAFALGVILCICFIVPKIVGGIVENEYDQIAQQLSEDSSIEIVERNFTNGWFGGESVIKFTFKDVATEIDNFNVIVTEQLSYGPVIFNDKGITMALSQSSADLSFTLLLKNSLKEEQKAIEQLIETINENLSVTSELSYAMNYKTHVILNEISYEEGGNQVNVGEIDSEFVLKDKKRVSGFLNWEGISFSNEEGKVNVAPVAITFDQKAIGGDFYSANSLMSGEFSLLFNNVNASNLNGDELFTFDNFYISANSEINEDLVDVNVQYRVDAFKGDNQDLTDINVDIAFKNLHVKTLLELNEVVNKFEQTPSVFPVQKIMESASNLLTHNPEIIVKDLSASTPDGLIKSDMNITVDNTLYDDSNPMSLIGALKANAKGSAPETFVNQLGLEGILNMYIEHGYIVRKNDNLLFEVLFNQGQLTVNGNVIPL